MTAPPAPILTAPLRRIEVWTLAVVAVLIVARLLVAIFAPISPDESYYWLWARPVQLSYFDHPGMVAWWIWCSTHVLGDTAIGVRLPAVLSTVVVSGLVWDTARIVWQSREAAARAVLWLNATLVFGAVGILMTPDVPLVLFWSIALWSICRLIQGGGTRWLYIAGLAFGLGVISKYTMGLLAPGAVVTFLVFPSLRHWFKSVHLWLALILSLLCTAPVVIWNAHHDWASIAKQGGHAFASAISDPIGNMLTFIGGQFGMATPIILIFILWATGWALIRGWKDRRADWFLLGASSLPVIAFFTLHALSNVVQAHWPGPSYIGGAIAAAGAPMVANARSRLRRSFTRAGPILGIVLTALVYLQASTALLPITPRIDGTKRLGGWDELAQAVDQDRAAHPDTFLLVIKHETGSLLTFHLPDHPTVFQLTGIVRPSFYTADDVAALKGRSALVVTETREGDLGFLKPYFERLTPLDTVTLHWGGRVADQFTITLAENYRGGVIVEGDGYPGALDKP
ncbi:MAG TPA: glycosyltransferase family 39 protein [Magnetospirillaceae bacterium]|jgi:hypothetical protein